ncbi:MAG: ChuX/HutX family heme-like substrate-binding protein, partial [Bosea sp. (in: a-proteobacteria)]
MPISQASAPAGQEPPAPLAVAPQALARIQAMLAQKPDGVIEAIAREVGVPTLAVLEATPATERTAMPPARFEALWHELAGWGEVLFIVHTPDI